MSSAPNRFFIVSWRFSTGPGPQRSAPLGMVEGENLPSLQAKMGASVSRARAIGAASKRISYPPLAAFGDARQQIGAISKSEGERDLVGIGAACRLKRRFLVVGRDQGLHKSDFLLWAGGQLRLVVLSTEAGEVFSLPRQALQEGRKKLVPGGRMRLLAGY